VLVDELLRCGLREAVLAPGSRSAPLALALFDASAGVARLPAGRRRRLRLHVRLDERSASFLALGLAKASGRPVAVVCTSGTAAAHFHAAVIEADESAVPLLVLTADRPPELRGTGANQTIDQVKLYGGAVRWFAETGVPEARPGQASYWRSLACRAWAAAAGAAGGLPGPVHLNLPFRDPLVPGSTGSGPPAAPARGWPDSLAGRPGDEPWTSFGPLPEAGRGPVLELPWTERGVVVCGDGAADPAGLARLAEAAGWPLLAEPSSGARQGAAVVPAYQYLLESAEFRAAHQPDLIISAGRPGLSRGQQAFLQRPAGRPPSRHIVIGSGPGRWADPARTATEVAAAVRLRGGPGTSAGAVPQAGPAGSEVPGPARSRDAALAAGLAGGELPAGGADEAGRGSRWLASWLAAGTAARQAADGVLDEGAELSEPRLARDLAALLPDGALLWVASSLPVRDLDRHMAPRPGVRVLASRGASGIDGLVSSAIGAALAHQAGGGGPAVALLGDLALLHDAAGLMLGPDEPRPDLCLLVVNNDGGGIFSGLEQAAYPAAFERVFGTPHGTGLRQLATAAKLRYALIRTAAELPAAISGAGQGGRSADESAGGLRLAEVRTDRDAGTELRARVGRSCRDQLIRTRGPGTG
jgi:2-succinyl-5-enolpyruvyl-6-hydroxy-3-cyclohexene-1-carboxylate synthase